MSKIRINEIESRLSVLEPKIEGNNLTKEEVTEVRLLVDELEGLEAEERAIEKLKNRKRDAAKAAMKSSEEKLTERFSFMKVVRSLAGGKGFTGAEAEVHEEGMKEARASQIAVNGFALPSFANDSLNKRATLDAATAATAGNLIATELMDIIPALRPKTILGELGANVMTGLVGNIDIPAGDGISSATFNTETGAASETNPTTKMVTMSPKRLAAWTEFTMQMANQSSIGLENWVLSELLDAEARLVDTVGILGGGTNQPVGIIGNAGTQVKAIGTNGGNLTRQILLDMETMIEVENADEGTMAYLTTPGVKGFLKNLISSAGVSPFVWQDDNTILGYNAYKSNLVPKNLTKGSTNGTCHAVIFGDFSKLLIGNWGVKEITVDNITGAKNGKKQIILNSFWDTAIVHPKAFVVVKDATI